MSNTAGSPTPAGWYRDPAGTDQLRWWNGTAWTAHLIPQPAAAPNPVVTATPVVQAPVVQAPSFPPTPVFQQANEIVPAAAAQLTDERPYVPFRESWNTAAMVGAAHDPFAADLGRPAAWNTVGVWFLATSLLWTGIIYALVGIVLVQVVGFSNLETNGQLGFTGITVSIVAYVAVWILQIFAAARDGIALRRLGYLKQTSALWILLLPGVVGPPLIYLIIRTVRVKRESGHGLAPLIFYLVSGVVVIAIAIAAAVAIPAFLSSRGISTSVTDTSNATSLASGITTGLDKNGGSYSVTCTPFSSPKTTAVDVTCVAIDLSTKVSHTLIIEVDPATNGGTPGVKLLNVNPPISSGS